MCFEHILAHFKWATYIRKGRFNVCLRFASIQIVFSFLFRPRSKHRQRNKAIVSFTCAGWCCWVKPRSIEASNYQSLLKLVMARQMKLKNAFISTLNSSLRCHYDIFFVISLFFQVVNARALPTMTSSSWARERDKLRVWVTSLALSKLAKCLPSIILEAFSRFVCLGYKGNIVFFLQGLIPHLSSSLAHFGVAMSYLFFCNCWNR